MVNGVAAPGHETPALVKVGVTEMFPMIGTAPLFCAGKTGTSPVPKAPRPIFWLLFVQAYVVPFPLKVTKLELVPLQKVRFDSGLVIGIGFTVMVNTTAVPLHPTLLFKNCGVTVTVDVTGVRPLLSVLKMAMLPAPDAFKPMEVVLFDQLKTLAFPVNCIAVVGEPAHKT